jgi:type IV pilus assembly protein PilC
MKKQNSLIIQKYFKYVSLYLSSGHSIDDSFKIALKKIKDKRISKYFTDFVESLREGKSIDDVLATLLKQGIVDSTVYALILVGQKSANLPLSLMEISKYLEKNNGFKKSLVGSMIYPAVVIVSASLSVLYIVYAVLPKILPIFKSLKAPLPKTTEYLLYLTDILSKYCLIYFVAISFILAIVSVIYMYNENIRKTLHFYVYLVPVFGRVMFLRDMRNLSLCLGTLLKSNMSIVDSFEVGISFTKNLHIRDALLDIKAKISSGQNLSSAITEKHLLANEFKDFATLGEATGTIAESFLDLSNISMHEYEDEVNKISKLVEPVALLISAGLVLTVALSVISPMYMLVNYVN